MKSFYIIINYEKPQASAAAGMVRTFLEAHGARVYLEGRDGALHGHDEKPSDAGQRNTTQDCDMREAEIQKDAERRHKFQYTDPEAIPADTECILIFGGDGSIIQAARDLQGTDIPLLGINMGYLGYLAQLGSDDDIEKALMELLLDAYTVESRTMLDGTVNHAGREYHDIALNDIVLSKIGTNEIRFELFINGRMIAKYSADGIIISTPTGSTAYNLSAGGPLAMPESELMILTPVAPHMLSSRSIVLPTGSEVHIRISEDTRAEQVVSFDGDTVIPLVPGDTIDASFSEKRTRLIQLNASMSFLDNINKRLQ